MGVKFPVVAMYPSGSAERNEKLGPFPQSLAMDGALLPGAFPLVVISHGSGGSHLVYRTLAAHLARNGFVVAMPEHPGNNRNNNDLAGTDANLVNRSRHIRMVMDWEFAKSGAVAIIGHSLGGHTALDVAANAARVRALVLLSPAAAPPVTLAAVRVPILMLTAGQEDQAPAEIIHRATPQTEYRVVPNAGRYSFLSPFPEGVATPAAKDPPGFDRVRFHEEMNADVLAFLSRWL